jgi:hypothetical protein
MLYTWKPQGLEQRTKQMNAFKIGDKVIAHTAAQGLQAGDTYTVTNVRSEYLPFGNFVTYVVTDGLKQLSIGNAQFLLIKVGA